MKFSYFVLLAFLTAALTACGGGGGGESIAPSAITTTTTNTTPVTTTPVSTPTTTTPTPTLLAGAEVPPTLIPAQTGSLAALGGSTEGLYRVFGGFGLIDGTGKALIRDLVGYRVGTIAVTGNNWSLSPGAQSVFVSSKPIDGSGTLVLGSTITGTTNETGTTRTQSIALSYSESNGLAATQTSVVGTWGSTTSLVITVDAAGNVAGSSPAASAFGACTLTGTLLHTTPSSKKNMFNISVNASGSACQLDKTKPYAGLAAITFVPAGNFIANGSYRTLLFTALTSDYSSISSGLNKQ